MTIPPRRLIFFGGFALVLASVLAGGLLYHAARGSPSTAEGARTASSARSAGSLRVIWPRDATWPRSLRSIVRKGTLRLRDLRGHPVVLNFFASWCGPCRREARLLGAAARRVVTRVVFLGADVNDYTPDARRFLRLHDVPYAAVRSESSTVKAFGLIGLPETFYLDRSGQVVAVTRGELTSSSLARGLRRIWNR